MNTLHKPLAVVILAVFIFISGFSVDFAGAQNTAVDSSVSQRPADQSLSRYLRFNRITESDGLSSLRVRGITQDNYGFMWFTTFDGLNRYDGASVKVYRSDPEDPYSFSQNMARHPIMDQSGHLWIGTWGGGLNQYDREKDSFIRYQHNPDDPNSLSSDMVRNVYEDRAGTIWVGTIEGLNKLDRESGHFTRYQHDPDDPTSLGHNHARTIFEDSTGVLWIGTYGGLDRFDPKTEEFVHYRHDPDDPASLTHNHVNAINEDNSGTLWVGTSNGLCKFNPEKTGFTCYQNVDTDLNTLSNNIVMDIVEDRRHRLWIGTWGGGLNQYDRDNDAFIRYQNSPVDPYSLSNDIIFEMYEDQQGLLWLSTDGGISIVDTNGNPFRHYRRTSDNPNSLSQNAVRSLHADRAGNVWIGSNGSGISKFNPQTEELTHYKHDPANPNSLSSDAVFAVHDDRMGMIWIGTLGQGLSRFDPETERFTHYRHDAANPNSLSQDWVKSIYEDREGIIWIGTEGGGLNAFDRETELFTRYQNDPENPHTLSSNLVTSVTEDQAGKLWIGTYVGLNKFDRETKTFTRYDHIAMDPQSMAHQTAISMYEDRTGTFWIGTSGGLDKLNRQNDQFSHYTTANGLPNDLINGILEDKKGRLWLSTANGLSRFDPKTDSFRNYTVSDGLQSNTFYPSSAYTKSLSGQMFFGGPNGFNAFYPDQIVDNPHPPPVLITDFQLSNKSVPIGGESVLQKSILETDEIVLSYQDRAFSFEIAVLNYQAPEKNRYKYMMEGFEQEWHEVDRTRRFVTYTNLDPGEYVFRAIGSNNDGIWNEEGDSIRIIVTPPWWGTLWFRIFIVVVAIGLLVGGFRWRVRASEARSSELENQVQKRTQELHDIQLHLEDLVTERTADLSKSEAKFRDLVDNSLVGVFNTNLDGRFLFANDALAMMYDFDSPEQILAKGSLPLWVDSKQREQLMSKLQEHGSVSNYEAETITATGRHIHVLFSVKLQDEVIAGMVMDITDRKEAEQKILDHQQRLKALASDLTVAEEQERRRIATDLHDNVGQSLALSLLQLAAAENSVDNAAVNGQFDEISKTLLSAVQDTQHLIFELSSPTMNDLGLGAAISEWVEQKVNPYHDIKVTVIDKHDRERLGQNQNAILLRSVRELLTNILKHSKADKATVLLEHSDGAIRVTVKDNGIGFMPEQVLHNVGPDGGLGLFSVEERLSDFGGSLVIDSKVHQGTTIVMMVPYLDTLKEAT